MYHKTCSNCVTRKLDSELHEVFDCFTRNTSRLLETSRTNRNAVVGTYTLVADSGLQWSCIQTAAFSDQQLTGLASFHTPAILTVTRVSLLLVRVCGTVCNRTHDKTLATDYLSKDWKHFCLGVNWPRRTVTVSCFVCDSETFLRTYLLTAVACV